LRLPIFDQLDDVANVPKGFGEPCGHGRGHADGTVNPGDVIPDAGNLLLGKLY
jgi:hypothetical protein